MNIVKTGTEYRLFDKSVEAITALPPIAFEVKFSKAAGFYLLESDMPDLRREVVYGDLGKRVDKVFKSYLGDTSKNLGVILSGDKGIGKTLFAKMAAAEAIKGGMPVIYVNDYIDGLPGFFRNISQNCLVVFDEFDKNFIVNDRDIPDETCIQDKLLSMFDGIYGGHKLFMLTCNDLSKLSDFYVNRPGRFKYHMRFEYPSPEDMRKYLSDKVGNHPDIERIVQFGIVVPLTYDCLSAIASELKGGCTFKEAMEMLNIVHVDDDMSYEVTYVYDLGGRPFKTVVARDEELPIFENDGSEKREQSFHVYGRVGRSSEWIGDIVFVPEDFRKYGKMDSACQLHLGPDHFKFEPLRCKNTEDKDELAVQKAVSGITSRDLCIRKTGRIGSISYTHML